MISPANSQTRQRSAGFTTGRSSLFRGVRNTFTFLTEAFPSKTRSASYCQNRYPSPSGWSGSNPRARPLSFRFSERRTAEFDALIQIILVDRTSCNVSVQQGQDALSFGGKRTCRRNSHSSSQQRSSVLQVATPEATSSARLSAAQSAAPRARFMRMVNASPARRSAQRPAHSQTTSDPAPARARNCYSRAVSVSHRTALFVVNPGMAGNERGPCSRKS